jgi:cell division protein ZapA (FtsZ GTPase activity inhibitor)
MTYQRVNYQVINAGVSGYGTVQELSYLKKSGIEFKPEIVMLNLFVGNDLHDNISPYEATVENGYLVPSMINEGYLQKARTFLNVHSHLYRLLEKGAVTVLSGFMEKYVRGKIQIDEYQSLLFQKPTNKKIANELDVTFRAIKEMDCFTKSINSKLIIILIPINCQVDELQKQTFIKNNYSINQQIDMDNPQKTIVEWARSNNISVVDLLPEMSKANKVSKTYWKLNGHLNVFGNRVVADILFDNIKNIVVR